MFFIVVLFEVDSSKEELTEFEKAVKNAIVLAVVRYLKEDGKNK